MNRIIKIAIFAITSSYIFGSIDAAGLRATNRSRTTTNDNGDNETTTNIELRLTDDDEVKFVMENGSLGRDFWERVLYASMHEDTDDGLGEEDDDQYRDEKTGAFFFQEDIQRSHSM